MSTNFETPAFAAFLAFSPNSLFLFHSLETDVWTRATSSESYVSDVKFSDKIYLVLSQARSLMPSAFGDGAPKLWNRPHSELGLSVDTNSFKQTFLFQRALGLL